MKCDSLSLPKYIDKSEKFFFIYGDEIILQNNARDYICNFYKKNGFDEKKIITSKDFPNISQIITQNAGGSLFGSRIIVEIIHEGGKIPKDIIDKLNSNGYTINEDEWDGKAVRLVTAWNTDPSDVESFLRIIKS